MVTLAVVVIGRLADDVCVFGSLSQVPPDVTVSFYFICMLHLANEKGLKLTGQDDLRNFTIEKDTDDE